MSPNKMNFLITSMIAVEDGAKSSGNGNTVAELARLIIGLGRQT